MAKVEQKKPVVDEIKNYLDGAQAAVLVDYRGLTVAEDTALRKTLREAGVTYKVYKNTMISFAIQGTKFEPLSGCLEGPSAIAISKDDATAPARLLAQFSKTAPALEFKAGVVDGTFFDSEGLKAVAEIPSKEVLLSRLLGSMQSPIASFARVLNAIAEQGGAPAEAVPAEDTQEAAADQAAAAEETAAE